MNQGHEIRGINKASSRVAKWAIFVGLKASAAHPPSPPASRYFCYMNQFDGSMVNDFSVKNEQTKNNEALKL